MEHMKKISFDKITSFFEGEKAQFCMPATMQPFMFYKKLLDLEEIDGLVQLDKVGFDYCLRPELTIALASEIMPYLEQIQHTTSFWSLGSIFYQEDHDPPLSALCEETRFAVQFVGNEDKPYSDAVALTQIWDFFDQLKTSPVKIRIGAMDLFHHICDQFGFPLVLRNSIVHSLKEQASLNDDLDFNFSDPIESNFFNALKDMQETEVYSLLERSIKKSEKSFVNKKILAHMAHNMCLNVKIHHMMNREHKEILQYYFSISGEPDEAIDQLYAFSQKTKLDISCPLQYLENRIGFIDTFRNDLSMFHFDSRFIRRAALYTGFLFEFFIQEQKMPVAYGGRHDQLFQTLGYADKMPSLSVECRLI